MCIDWINRKIKEYRDHLAAAKHADSQFKQKLAILHANVEDGSIPADQLAETERGLEAISLRINPKRDTDNLKKKQEEEKK